MELHHSDFYTPAKTTEILFTKSPLDTALHHAAAQVTQGITIDQFPNNEGGFAAATGELLGIADGVVEYWKLTGQHIDVRPNPDLIRARAEETQAKGGAALRLTVDTSAVPYPGAFQIALWRERNAVAPELNFNS